MRRCRQAGAAIVTAVLLVSLAAAAASFMLLQHDLRLRQFETLAARAQAASAAQSGIDHALRRLMESPALPAPAKLAFGEAEVDIEYADAQALFNLNSLVRGRDASEGELQFFQRLLVAAQLPAEVANAVLDAIDADSDPRLPGGAEDLDYLAMDPPRRAANRPLGDPAHLARLKGFAPQALERLRPWLTALPEATPLNVNTAPPELLIAAIAGLSPQAAANLAATRAQAPFADMEAFRARLPAGAAPLPGVALSVASRYTLVTSRARAGGVEIAYRALVARKGAAREGLLWRRQVED